MTQEDTLAVAGRNGSDLEEPRLADSAAAREARQELALAPLVDKLAQSLAKVLVVAMRELEDHVASETRKVGHSVGERLDAIQTSVQELAEGVSEQRSLGESVQDQCHQLAAAAASLQECDLRHEADLATLRAGTQEFSASATERIDGLARELGVQQEDIAAVKSAFSDVSSRVDSLVERLDRQAEALRSMCASYQQRESELDQLMDGLTRLKASRVAVAASRL